MGATFRDMTAADLEAGRRLSDLAGWNQTVEDWRRLLLPGHLFRGVVLDEALVGSAGAVLYGRDLAWVCMVLVDPVHRGRGLGSRLVKEVLDRIPPEVLVGLDATPLGQPVYERLGFTARYGLRRLVAEPGARPGPTAPPAPGLRPMREADLARVFPWDRVVFGADRSDHLRFAFAAAPELAFVLEGEGGLEGYALGRPGRVAFHLGPVVARDDRTASLLLSASASGHRERRYYADVKAHPGLVELLAGAGFVEQRPFARMYRGAGPSGPPPDLAAAFGPEFG